MDLVSHLDSCGFRLCSPPTNSWSLSADAAPHMQRSLKTSTTSIQLLLPLLKLEPITDNYDINAAGCCFPQTHISGGGQRAMKASCDNVPINSPNNRDLDQISHWFLQQTAELQSAPASLLWAWLLHRGIIILIKPTTRRDFLIRDIKLWWSKRKSHGKILSRSSVLVRCGSQTLGLMMTSSCTFFNSQSESGNPIII